MCEELKILLLLSRKSHEPSIELPPILTYPHGIVLTEEDLNNGMDDRQRHINGDNSYYRYVYKCPVSLKLSKKAIERQFKYDARQARNVSR